MSMSGGFGRGAGVFKNSGDGLGERDGEDYGTRGFDRGPAERGSRCDDGCSSGKGGGFGRSSSEQTFAKGDQGGFRSGGGGFSGTGLRSSSNDEGSGSRGGAGRVFGVGESGGGRDGGHPYGRDSAQGSGGGRFRSDDGAGFGGNGGLLNEIDGGKGAFGNPQDGGIDENRKGGFHNDKGSAITGGGGGFHRDSDGRSGFRGGEHSRFGPSKGFEDGREERSNFGQSRGFWNGKGERADFGQRGFRDGGEGRSNAGRSGGIQDGDEELSGFGQSGGFRGGGGERSNFGRSGGIQDGDEERSGFGQSGGFRGGGGERSNFGRSGGFRDDDGERSGFGQRGGFRDGGGERSGFGQRGGIRDGDAERSGFGQRGGFQDGGGERSGFGQSGGFRDGGGERSGFGQSGGFRDSGGGQSNFGRSGGFGDGDGKRSGFGQSGGFRDGGGGRSGFGQSGGFRDNGEERSSFGRSGGFRDSGGGQSNFGRSGGFGDGDGKRSGFGQRGGFRDAGGGRSGFGQNGGFRGSGGERSNFGGGGGFGDDDGERSGFGQRGGFRDGGGERSGFGQSGGFREGGGERSGFGQSGGFRDGGEERPNFGRSGGFRGSGGERSGFRQSGGFRDGDGERSGFGQRGGFREGGGGRSGFGQVGGFQDRDGVGAGGFRRTGSGGGGFRDEGGDFRDRGRHRFNGSSNTKGGFANRGMSEGGRRFFKDRESFGGGGFDGEGRFGGAGRSNNASAGGYGGDDNSGFRSANAAPSRSTYIPEDWSLEEMYEEDARNAKYEVADLDMEVIVIGVPTSEQQRKLQNWEDAGFEQLLMRNITKCSYAVPRRIQAAIIPLAMNGWDLLGHAETGSGKTLAFMLPIINCIMKNGVPENTSCAPIALVVAPTRELVSQLYNQTRKIAEGTGVTVAQCYGRTDVAKNVSDIRKGCNVLIATVGRLKSFVNSEIVSVRNIRFFVLDEADKMLQVDGFRGDMLDLIGTCEFPTKEQRQTMLFSATFDVKMQQFAEQLLKSKYAFVSNGKRTAANPRVQQNFIQVSQAEKLKKLCELLNEEKTESGDVSRTLVFVTRKVDTDTLAMHLSTSGIRASSIHGDRDQDQRENALREFRAGITKVLLATDVCARGIDVPNLEHVINYDLPTEWLVYVHRIGRTGRMHRGKATSFINPMEPRDRSMAPELLRIVREVQQEAPQFLIDLAQGLGGLAGTASQNGEAVGGGGFASTGGRSVDGGGGCATKGSGFARDPNVDDGFASADEDRVIAFRSASKGLTSTVSASGGGGDEFSGGKGGGGGGFDGGNSDRGEKAVVGDDFGRSVATTPAARTDEDEWA